MNDTSSKLLSFMPHWSHNNFLGIKDLSFAQLFYLALLLVVGIGIRFLVRFLFKKQLVAIFSRLNFLYLEKLLKKATTPLGNLAMVGFWAIFISSLGLNQSLLDIFKIAIRIFACLSFVMLAYRSIDVVCSYFTQKSQDKGMGLSLQLVPLFSRAMKIVIIILGGLFVLQNLHVDVTSLLAGMTLGGLAFSFAAKDTVANIFGSVTIFTDQSFKVGDVIKIGDVEGAVLTVGFRSTRIKTLHNSIVTIPNSKFTDSVVDNLSLREFRRVSTQLEINCETKPDDIDAFCINIRKLLKAHKYVQQDNFQVYLYDYGESSLNIMLKFHLKAQNQTQELDFRHEIFLDIIRLANNMNIQFAFPTRTLYIQNQSESKT